MWFIEDPVTPLLPLALISLVCIGWWNSSRRAAPLGLLALCCLIAAAGFAIDGLVVTDAEHVANLSRQLVDDFVRQRPDGAEKFDPAAPHLKGLYLAGLKLVELRDVRMTDVSTQLTNEGTVARCRFRVNADVSLVGKGSAGRHPARFELVWTRSGEQWLVTDVVRLHPIKDEEMPPLATDR
jgi:hypothetical protein